MFTVCPYCRERDEPDEPGVVYAVERRPIDSFGGRDYIDGWGGWFHAACPPGAIGYVQRERPAA